jgi:prepilin-type N-terminal cleavage/methylation domain-containing protein
MKRRREVSGYRRHGERGFSLLEMVMVVAIILVLIAISAIAIGPMTRQQHVTTAYNDVLMTLRRAHDQAAADMRVYVVSIAAPGTITVTQNTLTGPVLITTVLPSDITFHVETGVPTSPVTAPTTPDGFGTASAAIDFDQGVAGSVPTVIKFLPDGSAADGLGNTNNGVAYFGRVGDLDSSRAVTLWGSTGRIRGWRLYKNGVQWSWSQQ